MMQLKQQWLHLQDRVDAFSLRERTLIFLAAALVLATLVNVVLISPMLTRQQSLSKQIAQTQEQTKVMQTQIRSLVSGQSADPNAQLRAQLEQLQQQTADIDKALNDFQSGLVTPQQMPRMLEDILQRNRSLHLVSLKSLPMQNLTGSTEAAPAKTAEAQPPMSAVYKHGVEITVEGGYTDLLNYLLALESSPWRLFWGEAELKSGEYPKARLTLKLYSLSLDKAWMTI